MNDVAGARLLVLAGSLLVIGVPASGVEATGAKWSPGTCKADTVEHALGCISQADTHLATLAMRLERATTAAERRKLEAEMDVLIAERRLWVESLPRSRGLIEFRERELDRLEATIERLSDRVAVETSVPTKAGLRIQLEQARRDRAATIDALPPDSPSATAYRSSEVERLDALVEEWVTRLGTLTPERASERDAILGRLAEARLDRHLAITRLRQPGPPQAMGSLVRDLERLDLRIGDLRALRDSQSDVAEKAKTSERLDALLAERRDTIRQLDEMASPWWQSSVDGGQMVAEVHPLYYFQDENHVVQLLRSRHRAAPSEPGPRQVTKALDGSAGSQPGDSAEVALIVAREAARAAEREKDAAQAALVAAVKAQTDAEAATTAALDERRVATAAKTDADNRVSDAAAATTRAEQAAADAENDAASANRALKDAPATTTAEERARLQSEASRADVIARERREAASRSLAAQRTAERRRDEAAARLAGAEAAVAKAEARLGPAATSVAEARLSLATTATAVETKRAAHVRAEAVRDEALVASQTREGMQRRSHADVHEPRDISSLDPLDRVEITSFAPGMLLLRGRERDVIAARQVLQQVDKATGQLKVELWTIQLSGLDRKKLELARNDVTRGLDLARLESVLSFIALRDALASWSAEQIADRATRRWLVGSESSGFAAPLSLEAERERWEHEQRVAALWWGEGDGATMTSDEATRQGTLGEDLVRQGKGDLQDVLDRRQRAFRQQPDAKSPVVARPGTSAEGELATAERRARQMIALGEHLRKVGKVLEEREGTLIAQDERTLPRDVGLPRRNLEARFDPSEATTFGQVAAALAVLSPEQRKHVFQDFLNRLGRSLADVEGVQREFGHGRWAPRVHPPCFKEFASDLGLHVEFIGSTCVVRGAVPDGNLPAFVNIAKQLDERDALVTLGKHSELLEHRGELWERALGGLRRRAAGDPEQTAACAALLGLTPGDATPDSTFKTCAAGVAADPTGVALVAELCRLATDVRRSRAHVDEARAVLGFDERMDFLDRSILHRNKVLREKELRPTVAATDQVLKRMVIAFEEDLKRQFIEPRFESVRRAAAGRGVTFSIVERTSVLATNRFRAAVDPKATMEFDLPEQPMPIVAALQAAQALSTLQPAAMGLFQSLTNTPGVASSAGMASKALGGGSPASQDEQLQQGIDRLEQLLPEPNVYRVETGSGLHVTPLLLPDGQSTQFDIDYRHAARIEEPVDADEQHLPRIEQHHVHTMYQGDTFEIRELTRFSSDKTISIPGKRVPFLGNVPFLGWLFRTPTRRGAGSQDSLVYVRTVTYPAVPDIIDLWDDGRTVDLGDLPLPDPDLIAETPSDDTQLRSGPYSVRPRRSDREQRAPAVSAD